MPILQVGAAGEGTFEELPAMRDVLLLCKDIDVLPADDKFDDRLKFVFEILEVEEEEHDEHVGKEHWERPNLPKGKSGKLSERSNLYKLLEGMSGGTFDPGQEINTDDYVGKKFIGDFKRRTKKKNIGTPTSPNFVDDIGEDGKPNKKTVLENLRPVREKRQRATATVQSSVWEDEDED